MWIIHILFFPVFLLCTSDSALCPFPSSFDIESLPSRKEGEESTLETNGERLRNGAEWQWWTTGGRRQGVGGLNVDSAEAAFCGFSRGLAVGVSAFLLITGNNNTGTHADLSQTFMCLNPNSQRWPSNARHAKCQKCYLRKAPQRAKWLLSWSSELPILLCLSVRPEGDMELWPFLPCNIDFIRATGQENLPILIAPKETTF